MSDARRALPSVSALLDSAALAPLLACTPRPLAVAAVEGVARGYSTLEYDLEEGARGSRYRHCAAHLRELTGAEDALVVNSCATVGAGAFPTSELPSAAIVLDGDAERWSAALRAAGMPVIGTVRDGRQRLDLRTVPPRDVPELLASVVEANG